MTRATRLPLDWHPSPELIQWAKEMRPDLNIPIVIDEFKDYWANTEKRYKNWDLVFRNRIRNHPNPSGIVRFKPKADSREGSSRSDKAPHYLKIYCGIQSKKQIRHWPTQHVYDELIYKEPRSDDDEVETVNGDKILVRQLEIIL